MHWLLLGVDGCMKATAGGSPPGPVKTFDWTAAESVSAAIVDAVAAACHVEPTDLDPLYDAVDPDALDGIFASSSGRVVSGLVVEFPYNGVLVQVRASGEGRVISQ